jgi:hypothetical protein
MARPKKPLEPLIPLDKLKGVVAGLLAVPKDKIDKPQVEREKQPPRK